MASIPNLKTLRTGRRISRARVGRPTNPENPDESIQRLEAGRGDVVRQTDDDASRSRLSAVALGYLQDPYAQSLSTSTEPVARRYPLINRGTYVRTTTLDRLVMLFLETNRHLPKQIVSLGAGSDTRFFRLCANPGQRTSVVKYHEVDFEANILQKRAAIGRSAQLTEVLRQAERNGSQHFLHALDLRDLTRKSPPLIPNLDPTLPTLLLSECCLCYLSPDLADSIVQYFQMHVKASIALLVYEPIRPFDAFGKTMVANLASRGIHMQTLRRYSTLEAQRQRLRLAGFVDGQGARDMYQLWTGDDWVTPEERDRIDTLEWLDELEEWNLLASHYCVAWGWKGAEFQEAFGRLEGSRMSNEANEDAVC